MHSSVHLRIWDRNQIQCENSQLAEPIKRRGWPFKIAISSHFLGYGHILKYNYNWTTFNYLPRFVTIQPLAILLGTLVTAAEDTPVPLLSAEAPITLISYYGHSCHQHTCLSFSSLSLCTQVPQVQFRVVVVVCTLLLCLFSCGLSEFVLLISLLFIGTFLDRSSSSSGLNRDTTFISFIT